jgi:eukaryotic-like serine/threonine-protein kinase
VLLGVGGMACVYAATHRNGTRAAIKILHAELSINPQVRNRFLREGYVANSVGHEGAVKILDDDTADDGSLFLVTELLDGETLEERRIRFGGRLPEDDVLSAADQLLDVLVAAHAKGVVHRDIKPENVFLTRAGQVKVLDFGIARLREVSSASLATKTGASMGTPAYMPPEQARGRWDEVDGRTDLWACGATMFHLLSGSLVHDGRTTNEMLLSAMTKPAPPLSTVVPTVGGAVAYVVDRALMFEKDKRWPDAQTMQEGVRRAFHDRHGTPITTAPRLTVPETIVDRTLPSSPGAVASSLPTTAQPVESSRKNPSGASGLSGPGRTGRVALAIGVAVAIGITASVITLVSVSRRSGTTAAPSATERTPAALASPGGSATPVPVAAASTASTVPEVAATELPSASAAAIAAPRPAAVWRATPLAVPAFSATAQRKSNCTPPYELDAVGNKHWKRECL